jgi:hypothetical protein
MFTTCSTRASVATGWWLPLCPDCHQGPNGFHGLGGERPFRARYKIGEVELLAMTIERVEKQRRAA